MESIARIVKGSKTPAYQSKKTDSHLHSAAHVLADELSAKLNDRSHFAMYLGMAKKNNPAFLRKILGEVLELQNVKTPGKLFSFMVKKRNRELAENKS